MTHGERARDLNLQLLGAVIWFVRNRLTDALCREILHCRTGTQIPAKKMKGRQNLESPERRRQFIYNIGHGKVVSMHRTHCRGFARVACEAYSRWTTTNWTLIQPFSNQSRRDELGYDLKRERNRWGSVRL